MKQKSTNILKVLPNLIKILEITGEGEGGVRQGLTKISEKNFIQIHLILKKNIVVENLTPPHPVSYSNRDNSASNSDNKSSNSDNNNYKCNRNFN